MRRSTARRSAALRATLLAAAVAAVTIAVLGAPGIVLSIGFAICAAIWTTRDWRAVPGLAPMAGVGVLGLVLHFIEELLRGFATQFPALFGTQWSAVRFTGFNIAWMMVFALSAIGVARGVRIAFLGVLFLALFGNVVNGVGHLALSMVTGRVFPGTWTAPLLIPIGLVLLRRLRQASDVTGA